MKTAANSKINTSSISTSMRTSQIGVSAWLGDDEKHAVVGWMLRVRCRLLNLSAVFDYIDAMRYIFAGFSRWRTICWSSEMPCAMVSDRDPLSNVPSSSIEVINGWLSPIDGTFLARWGGGGEEKTSGEFRIFSSCLFSINNSNSRCLHEEADCQQSRLALPV